MRVAQRTHNINIRLTDSELAELKANMESNDYLSISKYIRTVVFERRIPVKKTVVTSRTTRNQINRLSTEITKIGNNFNQITKKLNILSNARKKNGDPVVNTKNLIYYIKIIQGQYEKIFNKQNEIIQLIAQSQDRENKNNQ